MSEWISIKDRLPEPESGDVLCYFSFGWMQTRNWDHVQKWDPCLTHWMPLPEPPEAEK